MEVTGAGQRDGSVGAQQRDGAGRYRGRSRLGTRGGLEAATVSRAQDRGGRVDRGVAGVPPRELCVGRAEQRAEAARLSELGSAEPDGGASVPLERRLGRHAWSYLARARNLIWRTWEPGGWSYITDARVALGRSHIPLVVRSVLRSSPLPL